MNGSPPISRWLGLRPSSLRGDARPLPSQFPGVMFRLTLDISPMEEPLGKECPCLLQALQVAQAPDPWWGVPSLEGSPHSPQLPPLLRVRSFTQSRSVSEPSTMPPKYRKTWVGGPYPFFQGNYITVPTFPATTSCSGQIPALRVPGGKQTPVSMFTTHPTESTQAKLSRYTFSLPAPHPPHLSWERTGHFPACTSWVGQLGLSLWARLSVRGLFLEPVFWSPGSQTAPHSTGILE